MTKVQVSSSPSLVPGDAQCEIYVHVLLNPYCSHFFCQGQHLLNDICTEECIRHEFIIRLAGEESVKNVKMTKVQVSSSPSLVPGDAQCEIYVHVLLNPYCSHFFCQGQHL